MSAFTPTERTQVRRLPKRGMYDRETVFKILDEAFVCHVGFVVDGQPYVIPTNFGRAGETLYLHGSAASRMLRTLSEGIPVCVTATLIDGLVLARSAFHHSVNYRSVVILGTARLVENPTEKMEVSAKVRTGGPVDDEEDYELPVWAGVLPLPVTPTAPIADARLKPGIAVPENVTAYSRNGSPKP